MGLKKLLFGFEFLSLCSIYIASFFLSHQLRFSVYGMCLIVYFVVQTYVSKRNDDIMKHLSPMEEQPNALPPSMPTENTTTVPHHFVEIPLHVTKPKNICLVVAGHRENPEYWKKCLRSICSLDTANLRKVYIMIDGNETFDQPMYSIAQDLLPEVQPESFPPIAIFACDQRGKRGMLYMAIEKVRQEFPQDTHEIMIAVTDSDTELYSNSLVELEKCMKAHPNNGCATGLLTIYNVEDGLLPKLINARYHYAFAVERACLSYFGCMTCCSGPLSIYKLSALSETVTKRFITQTILGVRCEPGDDRHLTNLIMEQGLYSRQSSYAVASTEAPDNMTRYLLQQLRWSRSFYRESYWQVKVLDKQSYFLGITTVYELLFPWFIMSWVYNLLFFHHPYEVYIKAIVLSVTVLLTRTIIMFLRFRKKDVFYNLLYYPLYFMFLLPTKLFANVTLLNNTWVTQSRDTKKRTCSTDAYFFFGFVALWQLSLVAGIGYTVYRLAC